MSNQEQQERTRADSRADYERLLATIVHQTGDPQRVVVDGRALWCSLVGDGDLDHDHARSALRAARDNDHVIRWVDGDGRQAYALTVDGVGETRESSPYGAVDRESFEGVIEIEVERDSPDRDVIGWANTWLAALEGGE